MNPSTPSPQAADNAERIRDFLARHGGAAARRGAAGDTVAGVSGWSEVYAADGYTLRCDWSRVGSRQEMSFTEQPPSGVRHAAN